MPKTEEPRELSNHAPNNVDTELVDSEKGYKGKYAIDSAYGTVTVTCELMEDDSPGVVHGDIRAGQYFVKFKGTKDKPAFSLIRDTVDDLRVT